MGTPFLKIIEAGMEELALLKRDPKLPALLRLYAEAIHAFLQADLKTLAGSIEKCETSTTEGRAIQLLIQARLAARNRELPEECCRKLLTAAEELPEWAGEIHFVLATVYEKAGLNAQTAETFKTAAEYLEAQGAKRKAIKALLNSVAAESRVDPSKKLLSEYHHLYKQARKLRLFGVAGQSLLNMSREYQLIGAHLAALKYADRAVALQKREIGTRSYYLALVHRCQLLIEAGRLPEAQLDYELALKSGFPEIEASLKILDQWFKESSGAKKRRRTETLPESAVRDALPTWKERVKPQIQDSKMGDLEDKLLHFVSIAPREKYELIEHLYGKQLPLEITENRLKGLLHNIRKKCPGVLIYQEGRYFLADQPASEKKRRSA